MGLINWIFDIYQHTQIDKARSEAAHARAQVAAIRSGAGGGVDAERLEHALGELALATKAIQRMMIEKGTCTSEEFAAKTLEEWQADCVIDGVELLPVEYLPRLLNRGLSSDQILFLSTQIKEGTPEAQVNTLVDAFINEETEVRLR